MKTRRSLFFASLLLFFIGIFSHPMNAQTDSLRIVDEYGQLEVNGTRIVNEHGDTVALRGMSLFWSQWIGKYYNYDCIQWLRNDWKCMVVRAAMAVESGGYLTNPDAEMAKVKTVIDACIDLGIYVIVDWHSHHAEDQIDSAISFFTRIASQYGSYPNLIYEIYNEPLQVSWTDVIKPYADSVISAIREIDSNNIILVGSPNWSQDVDVASLNPIDDENVAYSLHFYATTHTGWLRSKANTALSRGIALWVNEFGTCESSGDGNINTAEMNAWFEFMDQRMISWCNWSIADKDETSAALIPNAPVNGGWTTNQISESGTIVRNRLLAWYAQGYEPAPVVIDVDEQFSNGDEFNIFPNPVLKNATIVFTMFQSQPIFIEIYNIQGCLLQSFDYMADSNGENRFKLNLEGYKAGIYICKINSLQGSVSKRFQLLK